MVQDIYTIRQIFHFAFTFHNKVLFIFILYLSGFSNTLVNEIFGCNWVTVLVKSSYEPKWPIRPKLIPVSVALID